MCAARPHGDLTPSERQSCVATPQHRTLLPSALQPHLMQWHRPGLGVSVRCAHKYSQPAGRPGQTWAHGCPVLCQILSDTKELQKEINSLSGKLDRTFAVTDELVFKVRAWLGRQGPGVGLGSCLPICLHVRLSLGPVRAVWVH